MFFAPSQIIDIFLNETGPIPNRFIIAIAYLLGDVIAFSIFIWQFPLGSRASNLEIAIAGYEIALTVFTRPKYAKNWAETQNNLGLAYCNRIIGTLWL